MVEQGYALQLSILGLIAERHGVEGVPGEPGGYEYWSLGRSENEYGFGYVEVPLKVGQKRTGVPPEDFLPHTADKLAMAITRYIKGTDPFTARENPDYPSYDTYDQLMRLDEWIAAQDGEDAA
jgi:ATP-dependent helicase/nuclease subunit B